MTDGSEFNEDLGLYENMVPSGENIVDLGCGNRKIGDYGIDVVNSEDADMVYDLEDFPWPIEGSTFDGAVAICVLEHIERFVDFLNETHRILEDGSEIYLTLPHYTYGNAWADPTHKRAYALKTVDFLDSNNSQEWKKDFVLLKDFEVKESFFRTSWGCKLSIFNKIFNKIDFLYENSFLCYLNPARRIHILMEVVCDG